MSHISRRRSSAEWQLTSVACLTRLKSVGLLCSLLFVFRPNDAAVPTIAVKLSFDDAPTPPVHSDYAVSFMPSSQTTTVTLRHSNQNRHDSVRCAEVTAVSGNKDSFPCLPCYSWNSIPLHICQSHYSSFRHHLKMYYIPSLSCPRAAPVMRPDSLLRL